MSQRVFQIEIVRDGKWFMVHIPEINGLTQARHASQVKEMARDYIAVTQGLTLDKFRVEIA